MPQNHENQPHDALNEELNEGQSQQDSEAQATEAEETANQQIDGTDEKAAQPPKEQVPDFRDKYVRAMAEMENLRKRMARESEDARRYAVTGFAREMLDVADNLERATAAIDKEKLETDTHLKTLAEGVEMVQGQIERAFKKFQIEKTNPKPGEKFNPDLHQAMFEVPTDEHPTGTVAQVMQPGYVIAGRLLRPAMVGTAKPPQK